MAETVAERDQQLIDEAMATLKKRYRKDWHVVGAAIRLADGTVVTGVHLEANVGRVAVCAEAIALGRAVTEFGSSAIETVVAVRHADDGEVSLVSPCGMCREMISDYAPEAVVLMPADGGFVRQKIGHLLPGKYSRWAFETNTSST